MANRIYQVSDKGLRLGGIFVKDLVERGSEEVGVGIGKEQRGPKLEDIVMGTVGASKHAALAKAIDDVRGLLCGRGARGAFLDQIDTQEKAGAANVADEGVRGLELAKTGEPASTNLKRIMLKIFVA